LVWFGLAFFSLGGSVKRFGSRVFLAVLALVRLRHARGSLGVFIGVGCAAHDASRESCVWLASVTGFGFFVRGGLAYGVLLGLTWRSKGRAVSWRF